MSNLEKLINSLMPGDLIMYPDPHNTRLTCIRCVLRKTELGGICYLYLSEYIWDHETELENLSHPAIGQNPFHWDTEGQYIVNNNDDVPDWFSADITVERRAAMKWVALYESVPRLEHLRQHIPSETLIPFVNDPKNEALITKIKGIVLHQEAGDVAQRTALLMETLNISASREQIIGLATGFAFFHALATMENANISVEVHMERAEQDHEDDASTTHARSVH